MEAYTTMRPHYSIFMLTPKQAHRQSDVEIRTYKKVSDRPLPNAYSQNLNYFYPTKL